MNKLIQVVDYYKTTMYLSANHIVRVDETGLSDNCVIVYLTLDKPKDSIVLHMPEWERIKPMLDIAQNTQLQASKPDNALSTARAVGEIIQEEIQWIRIEAVERDSFYSKTTNSRRAMWRMITADGRSANLFDHADMLRDSKTLLRDSDYLDTFQGMPAGQHDKWTVSPIEVVMVPDGSFWKITKIKPRAAGAAPDPDEDQDNTSTRGFMHTSTRGLGSGSFYTEIDLKDEMFARKHAAGGYGNETDLKRLLRVVNARNFVVLDTETTGLGTDAEICQIAIIDADGKTLLDTLVKPKRAIPADATKIHGITNDMVKGARDWLNTNEQVWQLLHGRDVITYHADYDFRLIKQSEQACEPLALSDWHTISRACAMKAYGEHVGQWSDKYGEWQSHKLIKAATAAGYGLPVGMTPHRALSDCLMTLAVVRYLVEKHS